MPSGAQQDREQRLAQEQRDKRANLVQQAARKLERLLGHPNRTAVLDFTEDGPAEAFALLFEAEGEDGPSGRILILEASEDGVQWVLQAGTVYEEGPLHNLEHTEALATLLVREWGWKWGGGELTAGTLSRRRDATDIIASQYRKIEALCEEVERLKQENEQLRQSAAPRT